MSDFESYRKVILVIIMDVLLLWVLWNLIIFLSRYLLMMLLLSMKNGLLELFISLFRVKAIGFVVLIGLIFCEYVIVISSFVLNFFKKFSIIFKKSFLVSYSLLLLLLLLNFFFFNF